MSGPKLCGLNYSDSLSHGVFREALLYKSKQPYTLVRTKLISPRFWEIISMIITTKFLVFLQIFLFLMVFVAYICGDDSYYAGSGGNCLESERIALLMVKAELIDEYGRLSSWGSITNCCEWKGVVCDNRTNHVVALDLHGHPSDDIYNLGYKFPTDPLTGKISPSSLQLSHLQYLDLSINDFNGTTIPSFIGSFTKLRYLNLSFSAFGGPIPHHIGNLSALRLLDLGGNRLFTPTNLDWLSGSPSLQYLDLSWADLEASSTWLQVIHKLTALKQLHLSNCRLPKVAPISVPSINSSNSLLVLDLSYSFHTYATAILHSFLDMSSSFTYIDFSSTFLSGSIPDALWNLDSLSYLDISYNRLLEEVFSRPSKNSSSLTYLDLSGNNLNGQLSRLLTWLQNSTRLEYLSLSQSLIFFSQSLLSDSFPNIDDVRLPNLEYLDLSMNNFAGRLPNLSSCQSLRVLDLSGNAFNGSLSASIEHLSKIESLNVGFNQLEGVFHLSNLPHLRLLDLSSNLNLTLITTPSWIHPVQFQALRLADCKLGPYFPTWLQNQNQLEDLDISNSGIIDTIPAWFWGNIYECRALNMSHNQIYGVLPDLSSKFNELGTIDLSSNEFNGSLPHLPLASNIDLSRNRFSGTILSACNFKDMYILVDLSNNQLSGEIPQDCFMNLLSLAYLNLANNKLSGELPATNNLACHVSSVHLRNNSFRGEIPRALMNCSALRILDLGENEFGGNIPGWLGVGMPSLGVVILKSNMLSGSLPSSICHITNLQVLDISLNNITGTIPNCVNNFSLLSSEMNPDHWEMLFSPPRRGSFSSELYDGASVMWKGHEETYFNTLGLLKMIDLSSNELSGVIPDEITSLIGLVGLNLSRNNLVGLIPQDIDKMEVLNFLDLSRNHISGSIPPSVSKMSHLGVLDLSFNNLWGRIPWDSHLQTFEASSFSGNPRLCGPPLLSRPCPEAERPSNGTKHSEDEEEEEKFINTGFYISVLLGLVVAFWITFWTLFFNKWWNVWSMRICITVADWLYVKVLVNKRRLLRYFNNAS